MKTQIAETDFVINYNTTGIRGFSSMGYVAPPDLCYEEWETAGEVIKRVDRFKNFAIGDWLNAGEWRFGEMYAQAMDEFGLGNYDKLSKCKWVARSIPHANRRQDLTWSHHHSVASLTHDEQIEWLEYAVSHELTAQELTGAIKDMKQLAAVANRNELPPAPKAQPNTPPERNDGDDVDARAEQLTDDPSAYDESDDVDDVPFSHQPTSGDGYVWDTLREQWRHVDQPDASLWPDERICAMVAELAIEATDADGTTWHTLLDEDVCRLLRTMREEYEIMLGRRWW